MTTRRPIIAACFLCFFLSAMVATASAAKGPTPLALWMTRAPKEGEEWIQKVLIPRFEAEHGAKVEFRMVEGSDPIWVAHAGGVAPDVFQSASELMIDLRPYLRNWRDKDQIPQGLWKVMTEPRDGSITRVPLETEVRGIAYNPRLFLEAGLPPVVPPDWSELVTVVSRLTRQKSDGQYEQTGFFWDFTKDTGMTGTDLGWFLTAKGGAWTTPDLRQSLIDTPAMRETLTFCAQLYDIVGNRSPGTHFNRNNAAMLRGQPSVPVSYYNQNPEAELGSIGLVPVQAARHLRPVASAPSNGLGISIDSKNPDLAWKLITFFMSYEMQSEYIEFQSRMVTRRDVATRNQKAVTIWRDWYQAMEYVENPTGLMNRSAIAPLFASFYNKEIGLEEAIANATRIHQAALNEYWDVEEGKR